MIETPIAIHWFRRDLRLNDNAGLYHALKSGLKVMPIFIFDTDILDKLSNKKDPRVHFIHETLGGLKNELRLLGSDLEIYHGKPIDIWQSIVGKYNVKSVFSNTDYEPYALNRDQLVKEFLKKSGIDFHTFKDHVVLDKDEVLKDDGSPYTVFTPYSKKYKSVLTEFHLKPYPVDKYKGQFLNFDGSEMLSLKQIGFETTNIEFPPQSVSRQLIANYHQTRDIPSINGTSKLSLHYRFGTVSVKEKMASAKQISEKYFNEMIWREFYIQIMAHFPYAMERAFKPAYDRIAWENDPEKFEAWCKGMTGYPIVDAGMRELNETGYMHNRVRMIVASFLCKHLLIDWRWGEAYFAEKLLDFELACNNGGWQWAAGSGVDAAPYFRIFNPYLQAQKFDPEQIYIRKWVPEFGSPSYPEPIVIHETSRVRCLEAYKEALASS